MCGLRDMMQSVCTHIVGIFGRKEVHIQTVTAIEPSQEHFAGLIHTSHGWSRVICTSVFCSISPYARLLGYQPP